MEWLSNNLGVCHPRSCKCLDAKGHGVVDCETEINDRMAPLYTLRAESIKVIRGE